MSTQHPDIFGALAAPFEANEVKVRSQAGRQMHYITARTAMNRLDNVVGPENWWDEYEPHEKSVLCRLTVRLPDGQLLTKADAGGYAGMSDEGDDDKSGYSDAFKRACVKFCIARYLYRDGVPLFDGFQAPAPETPYTPPATAPSRPSNGSNGHAGNGHDRPPLTGKALFAWVMDQQQKHSIELLRYVNGWAKLQEFPARMVDWDANQVLMGHAEAVRILNGGEPTRKPPDKGAKPGATPAFRPEVLQGLHTDMAGFIAEKNGRWAQDHADGQGEVPPGLKDLTSGPQVMRHLLKWAVKTKRLSDCPQLTLDPKGKVVGAASLVDVGRYLAIVLGRETTPGQSDLWEEADAYVERLARAATLKEEGGGAGEPVDAIDDGELPY